MSFLEAFWNQAVSSSRLWVLCVPNDLVTKSQREHSASLVSSEFLGNAGGQHRTLTFPLAPGALGCVGMAGFVISSHFFTPVMLLWLNLTSLCFAVSYQGTHLTLVANLAFQNC